MYLPKEQKKPNSFLTQSLARRLLRHSVRAQNTGQQGQTNLQSTSAGSPGGLLTPRFPSEPPSLPHCHTPAQVLTQLSHLPTPKIQPRITTGLKLASCPFSRAQSTQSTWETNHSQPWLTTTARA